MRRSRQGGFTLLELVIALAIVGALLVIAFGGLRVGLAAWAQGEDRAEAHQHLRGIALVLERALATTYPYRAPIGAAPQPTLLFRGAETRVEFVTQSPPAPASIPIAFTAVVMGMESDEVTALVVRQRPLPNRDPFTAAVETLRDPSVSSLRFRYLGDDGAWRDTWDAEAENALPRAVEITVASTWAGRGETLGPLAIPMHISSR
jgi:general secretion pathway protein J